MSGSGYPLRQAERRLRQWRQWSGARGKPLFLSELGSMVFGWRGSDPGPRTFPAALKDAELVVRALNLGVDGFNRWSFINRGDLDGQWQMIETWNPAAKGLCKQIVPAPNSYFVYGLLSRFTAKHSRILSTEVAGGQLDGLPRVFATALRSPANNLTVAIVNDASQPWEASVEATALGVTKLFMYQISSEERDQPSLSIEPRNTVRTAKGRLALFQTLPPMSLTLFSSYHLRPKDRGIVKD
jgi:hypothetical protein